MSSMVIRRRLPAKGRARQMWGQPPSAACPEQSGRGRRAKLRPRESCERAALRGRVSAKQGGFPWRKPHKRFYEKVVRVKADVAALFNNSFPNIVDPLPTRFPRETSGRRHPPLPCFYPHSEWAASGPGALWGPI